MSNHLESRRLVILSIRKLLLDKPKEQQRIHLHLHRLRMRTLHFQIDLLLLLFIPVACLWLILGVEHLSRLLYNLGDSGLRHLVLQVMRPDRMGHLPIRKTLIDRSRLGRRGNILLIRWVDSRL